MFLIPFLRFFKPYRWRLLLAVACLTTVALLTALPVVVLKEAVNIGGVIARQSGKAVEGSGPLGILEMPTGHSDTDKIDELKQGLQDKADAWTGGLFGKAAGGVRGRLDAAGEWYREVRDHKPLKVLGLLVILMIAAAGIKGTAEYTANYHISYSMLLTNMQIREHILGKVLSQDYLYFTKYSPGWLISRINSDTNRISEIIQASMSSGIQNPLTLMIMFVLLVWLSPSLTLLVFGLLPVIGGILYYFARIIRKNQRKRQKKSDQLSGTMTESLTNVRLVKAFGTEKIEEAKFHERTMAVFKYMMKAKVARFGSSPLMEFIGTAAGGGIAVLGCRMILKGDIALDIFIAYLYALSRFYRPIKALSNLVNKYQTSRVSGERMMEMLALQPKLTEAENPSIFEKVREGIELRDVRFHYEGGDAPALDGIDITVKPGQCIGFAGRSGSGKTTLVNMIARLIDPDEGEITIDGVNLRQIRMADWRSRLGMVTQETMLFEDTIANNIAYGSPGAVDMERVKQAAVAAHADEFIAAMPEGYKTLVGTGGLTLSGGQRQRIAIARALYRDPEILILDEATSALDSESQAKVQTALERLMAGRTTFVIAHRISTIRNADCIYVFEEGRVVESGTHDELVSQGGVYATMVTRSGTLDGGEDPNKPTAANGEALSGEA